MRNLLKRLKAFSRSDKGSPEIISTAFDGRTQVQTITSSALDGVTEVLISEDNSSAKRYQIKELKTYKLLPLE